MTREQMLANLHEHLAKVREECAERPRPTLDDLAASDPQLHERVEALRALIPSESMREPERGGVSVEPGMDENEVVGS